MIWNASPKAILIQVIAVILSMSIHEMAHGLVSYWFGDATARNRGRLSLNPLAHIDWMGLLCLLVTGFGWAKPVPVDPSCYKDPKQGMIWTAFAGPLANFLVTALCVFVYYLILKINMAFAWSTVGDFIESTLATTAVISAGFGIFNLIPIPPLDGSKILLAFLPDREYYRITRGNIYTNILFMALIFSGLITGPISALRNGMIGALSDLCMKLLHL